MRARSLVPLVKTRDFEMTPFGVMESEGEVKEKLEAGERDSRFGIWELDQ